MLMKSITAALVFFALNTMAQVQPALIKVSSYSETSVDPNIMNINVHIWAKANSADASKNLVEKNTKIVKESLEKFKIKKEDIQTQNYSVTPEYAYEDKTGVARIKGYQANHTLLIVFKNIDQGGQFINQIAQGVKTDKSDNSGISISSINWDSDKKSQAEKDSVTEAVRNARARAEDLAKAAGVKIKGVYQIVHQQVFANYENFDASPKRTALKYMSSAASQDSGVDLNAGKIKIRADVSVDYYIQN